MRNLQWMSAGLLTGLLSCAAPSFVNGGSPRTAQSGAAAAKDGIEVAVTRHSCSQTADPDFPGDDLVEAIVEVEVRNGTSAPVVVHRDRFQLGTPHGGALRTSTWFARAPRSVEPGQARTFELRFMTRGELSCSKEMVLESSSAVEKGADKVTLGAITLVPAETPSGHDDSSS